MILEYLLIFFFIFFWTRYNDFVMLRFLLCDTIRY